MQQIDCNLLQYPQCNDNTLCILCLTKSLFLGWVGYGARWRSSASDSERPWVLSLLVALCCVLEQDTLASQSTGPKVIKLFSCSAQLSLKFILLINVKMPTIVGIFMSPEPKVGDILFLVRFPSASASASA